MRVGCVREIKKQEYRVGLTPGNVKDYIHAGHEVYIEKDAGVGSGFSTAEYVKAGAKILDTAKEVWDISEMIVKFASVLSIAHFKCMTIGPVTSTSSVSTGVLNTTFGTAYVSLEPSL